MFRPKFAYTYKLINNLGAIRELIGHLNEKRFPNTVLLKLEKDARALSSHSSTSIEGNPIPLTDVKKILKTQPKYIRDTEKEVLNYNSSLLYLDKLLEEEMELSDKLICHVQKLVTTGLVPKYAGGTYRKQPVLVNNPITREVIYWPPDHQDVASLMSELLDYVNTTPQKVDNIILAGIFHQQFVLIHPFLDGNGRTARLITKVLLAKMGLNTFPLFSFENYYNANITRYFQKVGMRGNFYDEIEDWDYTEWLEYFTDGIIDELKRVKDLLSKPTSLYDRLEDHHMQILDLLDEYGVLKDTDYEKVTDRSRASRVLDYSRLVSLGMIERHGKGRGTYYVLKDSSKGDRTLF